MRHYKFRAWDEETETMLYSDKDYETCTFVCESEGYLKCYVPEEVPASLDEPSHLVGREIFEIMEFTGKLDKNAKDIYEHDRMKEGVIRWSEEDCAWKVGDNIYKLLCEIESANLEVIGNIHEETIRVDN